MPREPDGFREQLARLSARFPDKEAISLKEACTILAKDRRTLLSDKTFPAKRISGYYSVTLTKLAWWMSS